jgi:hypothetical protein
MSSLITFKCPYCNKTTQLSSDLIGKKGRCPHCKTVSRINPVSAPSQNQSGISLAPEIERPKTQTKHLQQVKYTLPHTTTKRIQSYSIKTAGVLLTLGILWIVGQQVFQGLTNKGQTTLEQISSRAIKRLELIYPSYQVKFISTQADRGADNLSGEFLYTIKWLDESVDEYRATFFYQDGTWTYLKTDVRQILDGKPNASTAERNRVIASKKYGVAREVEMWQDLGVLQPDSTVPGNTGEQSTSVDSDETPDTVTADTATANKSVPKDDVEKELPFSLPKEAGLERFAAAKRTFNQKVNEYSIQIRLFEDDRISAEAFLLMTEQFIPHLLKSKLLIDTDEDQRNWDDVKKFTLQHAETALRKAIDSLDANTKTNAAQRFKNNYRESMGQIAISKQQDVTTAIEAWGQLIEEK